MAKKIWDEEDEGEEKDQHLPPDEGEEDEDGGGGGGSDALRSHRKGKRKVETAKKEAKKKKLRLEAVDGPNLDDDAAPDEFTMSEGKDIAQKLRNEERENKNRIAAGAKKRRLDREAKRQEEKMSSRRKANGLEIEVQTNPGLLHDSVVQFLSEREKAISAGDEEANLPHFEKKPAKERSKKEKLPGRVQVVLLDSEYAQVDRSALEFKRNQLFGSRIKRDPTMLQIKSHSSAVRHALF